MSLICGQIRTRKPSLQPVQSTAILTSSCEFRPPDGRGLGRTNFVFSVSFEESAYTLGSEQGAVRIFIPFTDHQACKFTVNSQAASLRCPGRWLVAVAPPNWWSSLPCNFHTAQAVSFELQVHALGKGARSGEGTCSWPHGSSDRCSVVPASVSQLQTGSCSTDDGYKRPTFSNSRSLSWAFRGSRDFIMQSFDSLSCFYSGLSWSASRSASRIKSFPHLVTRT